MRIATDIARWSRRHPVVIGWLCAALYFVVLQLPFITTGDLWAEAYMEYLLKAEAPEGTWGDVIAPSWEGYVTFLPSFFTKLFVSLGIDFALIDGYLRAVTVLFTVSCLVVVCSPLTKKLLPQLWQRLVVMLGMLLTLWHVSALSFINIWYVGFVPFVVLAVAATRMKWWQQVVYTLFGLAVAFTKPSIILVPFLVYRAVKTKEYISNGILLLATLVQTYFLFFATSNGERKVAWDVWHIIHDMFVGSTVSLLKLVHLPPNEVLLVVAAVVLLGLFALLVWRCGWWVAGLVGFCFLFSVYGYVLTPEAAAHSTVDATLLFNDHYKIQREVLIGMSFIFGVGLLVPHAWRALAKLRNIQQQRAARVILCIGLLVIGLILYRPIDVISGSVAAHVAPFRSALSMRQPVCMPVAPLPSWSPGTNWFYAHGGGCEVRNASKKLATDFTMSLQETPLDIIGTTEHSLLTVMVPVNIPEELKGSHTIKLTDDASGMAFTSRVANAGIQFAVFNVSGLPVAEEYSFTLAGNEKLTTGLFTDGTPAVYGYLMIVP